VFEFVQSEDTVGILSKHNSAATFRIDKILFDNACHFIKRDACDQRYFRIASLTGPGTSVRYAPLSVAPSA